MGCHFSKEADQGEKRPISPGTTHTESSGSQSGAAGASNPEPIAVPELLKGAPASQAAQAAAAQQDAEAPCQVVGTVQDVVGTAQDVVGTLQDVSMDPEQYIDKAAKLRDEWLSDIAQKSGDDMTVGEVDVVLDTVEKVVTTFRDAFSSKEKQRDAAVDIQSLQLTKRTAPEQFFAKYSALGQMLIDMSGPAMEAMPFGAPAAAVIGAVYGRAAQAARLSRNAEILLQLLKLVDAQLARVLGRLAKERKKMHDDVMSALKEVLQQTTEGGRLMKDYVGQGFVLRFILSKGNELKFTRLDRGIRDSMLKTSFVISMDQLANPADYQPDGSAELRAAVCAAAGGMPEENAQDALRQLRESQPGKLAELFQQHAQQHGSYSEQVLIQLVQDVQEDVQQLKSEVKEVRADVQQVQGQVMVMGFRLTRLEEERAESARRQEGHIPLKAYLNDWWKETVSEVRRSVSVEVFFKKLVSWFKNNGKQKLLLEYEEELHELCPDVLEDMLKAAPKKICEENGQVLVFFTFVVMPMVDVDKDGKVNYQELLNLQVIAEECMRTLNETKPPAELGQLMNCIYRGFDAGAYFKKVHYKTSTREVNEVAQKLEVTPMLETMLRNGAHRQLKDHVPETRQWLFNRVNEWLQMALSAGLEASTLSQNRMFLLVAGPGMGKTIFSAVMEKKLLVQMQTKTNAVQRLLLVRHFFRVSEPRAQGKAMVLCLAMQLAEQLPGMAQLLLPVAQEHGSANQLSLKDTFEKYLLEPLTGLDEEHRADQPIVVMLLDAMDESTDGDAGYGPVTQLVGQEMSKLPAWVKLVLTGRPEMESSFKAWRPVLAKIEPKSKDNEEDLRLLLEARLKQDGRIVSAEDAPAAVDVMLKKAEGQFIWTKYGFDVLCGKKDRWTPAEMQEALPSGIDGMFCHVMGALQEALQEGMPDILTLLRQQLLPVLVAAKSPLSPRQLALVTGAEQSQVELLLRLLANMFPLQERRGILRAVAYHKSVLDWLTDPSRSKEFFVDAGGGDQRLGRACFSAVKDAGVCKPSDGSSLLSHSCSLTADNFLEYALRFGVAHLCLAHSCPECLECLERIVMDFTGFWRMAFEQGCGTDLLKDLLAFGPKTSIRVQDVVRWLRLTSSYLSVHPRATLQLACDAPHNTEVSKHANSLPEKPQAQLLTKDGDWSACINTLTGLGNVLSMVVSANTIVSCDPDFSIRVFDLESGVCQKTLGPGLHSLAISSDARFCVAPSCNLPDSLDSEPQPNGRLRVWDLESGTCVKMVPAEEVPLTAEEEEAQTANCVAISTDARSCVSCSMDKAIRVWDLEQGACKKTIQMSDTEEVMCVAIIPPGACCVTGSGDEEDETGMLRVWDLETGTCMKVFSEHTGPVNSVVVSPDGSCCVSGSDDTTVRVWNLETGTCLKTLSGHAEGVVSVAISPDARFCASGSWDKTIRIWGLDSGVHIKTLSGHTGTVSALAFSSDSCLCVSGSADGTIKIWDLNNGASESGLTSDVRCLSTSSDAQFCVSGYFDGTLRFWSLEDGSCQKVLAGHTYSVDCVGISLDNRVCVSGTYGIDGTLRAWKLDDGTCMKVLPGHKGDVLCVAISPDARLCVSGSSDKTVRVWDLKGTSEKTLRGHTGAVRSVAISSDARLCISGSRDKTIRVWNLEDIWNLEEEDDRQEEEEQPTPMKQSRACKKVLSEHTGGVTCVAVCPDGSCCVSGSVDETIRVWDLETGTCLKTLSGHADGVESVAISPDARLCVAMDGCGCLREKQLMLWDISTGEQLACHGRCSEGGARLEALANCWRAGKRPALDEVAGNAVAWLADQGRAIQWKAAAAGSLGMSDLAVSYLMPPMHVDLGWDKSKEVGLLYDKSSRSVRFFDEVSNQLVSYKLLV